MVRQPSVRTVDGRPRGGGHAARAGRLAGVALRGRAARAARLARRAHARRDARARARAGDRPAPHRQRGGVQLRHLRAGLRTRCTGSACGRRSRARIRSCAPRTSRSPRRPLPVPALQPSRAGAREPTFALHVHVAVPDPSSPSAPSTACAPTSPCCSRWPRTRPSRAAATAAWPPPARPSSRPSRAPASRASSAPTPNTPRRSTS